MVKNGFAIFLFVVFANFIVAPTVISIVDANADVSMVFNVNEEEHKENEFEKDELLKILHLEIIDVSLLDVSNMNNEHFHHLYSTHYQKLHLPPPELS